MDNLTKILYFILAIVLLASIGVTVPVILDYINNSPDILKNLNQNLITYYIAIFVTSSLDIVIKLFDVNEKPEKKPIFLGIAIFNIILLVGSSFLIAYNKNSISYFVILGVILSYIIWWLCNYDNENLKAESSLGGNPKKEPKNG